MKRSLQLAVAFSLVLTTAFAGKLAPELRGIKPGPPMDVMVRFYYPPTADDLNAIQGKKGVIKKKFNNIQTVQVINVPTVFLNAIAALKDVKYVAPIRKVTKNLDITAATIGSTLANQYGYTGRGIGVAVIDSGVDYTHADLAGRVVYNQDFTGSGTAMDQFGHGTHVAGIIAGSGANSNGKYVGVAPGANIVNLRALDVNGSGTDETVIDAIDTAISLRGTYNIRVINLSLGRPISESFQYDPLCAAVEEAYQAGITVVVAAGNNGRSNYNSTMGYGTITSPGNDPYVITVGAMNTQATTVRGDDIMASYSSKGPTVVDHFVKPDLVAPGNQIVSLRAPGSTLDVEYPGNEVVPSVYGGSTTAGSQYFIMSGTSMATPVVAGTAAILLSQNPAMTPDQIKARLMRTATKNFPTSSSITDPTTGTVYTDYYDIFTVGAGYLDVNAAISNTTLAIGAAVSPVALFSSNTSTVSIVSPSQIAWDASTVFPLQIAWDDNSSDGGLDGLAVWGASVVDSTNTAFTAASTPLRQNGTEAFKTVWDSQIAWDCGSSASLAVANGDPK